MSKGIEPQFVTDAVHGTISFVQKHTPARVQKAALNAAKDAAELVYGPPKPMQVDREAG